MKRLALCFNKFTPIVIVLLLVMMLWGVENIEATPFFGTEIFNTTMLFTDVGLSTYSTPVNINLTANNFYILSFQTLGETAEMRRIDESPFPFPAFITTDGNFSVIDGTVNGGGDNGILPAFSVNVASTSVDLFIVTGAGNGLTTFTMLPDQTRETFFQSLNNITLSELRATIDPNSSSSQFRWRIFESTDSPPAPIPPVAVPEPSTLLLLGSGLVMFMTLFRKRLSISH